MTVIGINSVMLGGGGLVAYFIWRLRHRFPSTPRRETIFGGIAAAVSVISSGLILALALVTTGEEFVATAGYALLAHVPVMVIEGIVVGVCAAFLAKVKPEILAGQVQKTPMGHHHAT
ncbi:MAG: hypothetical protein A2Z60_00100 [Nitrospirae bacterium RIFCSPLOWO2_02_42_7]|nr:MAG: hypothetical protein A2Z60_00100 [Nitrospirae bacterium RIFCSPLOWO2_02_42_7]